MKASCRLVAGLDFFDDVNSIRINRAMKKNERRGFLTRIRLTERNHWGVREPNSTLGSLEAIDEAIDEAIEDN